MMFTIDLCFSSFCLTVSEYEMKSLAPGSRVLLGCMILNMSNERVTRESSQGISAQSYVDYLGPPKLEFDLPKLSELPEAFTPWKSVKLPIDVLLVTAKDWEFLSCYHYLRNPHQSHYRGLGIVYLGDMGAVKQKLNVCLLRCSEGAAGPGAALSKVNTAVIILRPKAVFCVGFCGGLSCEKVKLGDVVISAKIITYAHKKVMNNREQSRGYVAPVSSDIANLIKDAASGWKAPILKKPEVDWEPVVHCDGVILSGPELVACEWRREELLEMYPKALAIEMEGEGVFAAAHDLKMEWVVIKGVSDYADDNKSKTEQWQPFASVMAASVVANMLKFPGVLDDWEHYRGVNHSSSGPSSGLNLAGKLIVGSVIVLLMAIAILNFCPSLLKSKNIKNLGIQTDVIHSKLKGTPQEDPLATLLKSITGGPPGQVNYKGRTISYRAQGRIHSLDEPWVYDGTAWDIESGIKAKVKHYKQSGDAVKDAIAEVIKKLKEQLMIKD